MTTTQSDVEHRAHLAFHLTGTRPQGVLHDIDDLKPALFAPYADLTRLRYDFPVVLLRSGADTPYESLSAIVGRLIAQAGGGERARKILHRHERTIRNLVANGTSGSLGKLWKLATPGEDPVAVEILEKARRQLDIDGQVVDCDATLTARLFIRAWRFAQDRKLAKLRAELDRLVLKLGDILRADAARSDAARTPERLKACVGVAFEDAFDFDRLSSLLTTALPAAGLTPARRARIEDVLETLQKQSFVRPGSDAESPGAYRFFYTSCGELEQAYRDRLPELTKLARAMAIGVLEAEGEYSEAQHDALFEAFGANGLTHEELAEFPDYLLWLHAPETEEYGEVTALLGANVPVKIMVQLDDLLETSAAGNGQFTLSLRSKQLADIAIGLSNVYVLQSTASNLVRMRSRIMEGLAQSGPALFTIYSGAHEDLCLPAYLASAAALESRAFPAFTYDPAAGDDWAARFSLDGNPQPERDWPAQSFMYEEEHERVEREVEFTVADFMACDPRYARHFAKVPAAKCNGDMLTLPEWLQRKGNVSADRVPALLMVDRQHVIQRVIVDSRAIGEARRVQAIWRSLQELGGIHNSHAERLLAREKEAWEEEKKREIEALKKETRPAEVGQPATPPAPAIPPAPAPQAAAVDAEEKSSDEAYIETPRCTTCEECVHINNRMFVYDTNKQAYIADLKAGTYRQLVEAAEACQVSIIHPGKPTDPSEAGMAELLERAQAFN